MAKEIKKDESGTSPTDEAKKIKKKDDSKKIFSQIDEEIQKFDMDSDMLLNLSEEKEQEIANQICTEIQKTISNQQTLISNIRKNHEIYELVPEGSDIKGDKSFELDDSPGLRSIYGAAAVKGKIARYMMSMFSAYPYAVFKIIEGAESKEKEFVQFKLQSWFHFMLDKIMKIKNRYREVFFNTAIENECVSSVILDVNRETIKEKQQYNTLEEFQADFASAKEAGISKDEYDQHTSTLLANQPVTVTVRYEKMVHIFPTMEAINREDFGLIPADAKWETKRGAFQHITKTWNDLAIGKAEGRYKNVDKVLERGVGAGKADANQAKQVDKDSKRREGISEDPADERYYKNATYDVYRVLYQEDINDDGIMEDCIFLIDYGTKTMLRAELWDNNWFLIPHYIERKPNRFAGIGIIEKVKPIVVEADAMTNLRMKVGKMVTSPSFKARKGSDFDPGRQKWFPGCIWWMENNDDIEQLVVTSNFPELYQEESLLERKNEMVTGMSSGMSGRELPQDPSAPGNKTIALIREGNILINEDIDVLRESVEEVFYAIIKMADKYIPEDDIYLQKFDLKKSDLKILKEEISLHGISVANNIEMERQEGTAFFDRMAPNPLIQNNPESFRQLTSDLMIAWGRDPRKYLPTAEQLEQQQIARIKEAMKQLQAEQAAQQEEAALAKNLADAGFSPAEVQEKLKQAKEAEAMDKGLISKEQQKQTSKPRQGASVPMAGAQ